MMAMGKYFSYTVAPFKSSNEILFMKNTGIFGLLKRDDCSNNVLFVDFCAAYKKELKICS
jgi:hypothetical protein